MQQHHRVHLGGPAGRRGQSEVAHAVPAVHVMGGAQGFEQRPLGAPGHGNGGCARLFQDGQRVPHHLVHVRVPGDTADRAQVEARVADGEQQGEGVVDAGVAVDDHGDGPRGHEDSFRRTGPTPIVTPTARRRARPPAR